jgi:uncharacterized protein YutE (UPF0331/DUF86 family)
MNRERITLIIADIEKYLKELEELNIKTIEDLKERKNFYSASMLLLTIFNRVIDLGQELVLRKKLGVPATYSEIFALLRKANIINNKFFSELREIVKLRNRLSHEYFAFTEKDVFEGLKKIKIVKQFIKLLMTTK